jgi:hypothetical protein
MNNDNDGHNLLCLICANVHVYPRIYKCGHTVCSCCMQEIDVREHSSTFEVPIYKCPCCREKTIIPWNKRPLNRVLETLCKSHPDYKSRKKEVDILLKDRTEMVEIPENVDISRISYKCRKSLAGDLYSKILPVLYEAAICGKSFVTITEENFVSQIEACVTELKKLLFDNNIFKIIVTPNECTIYINKSSLRWKREWRNQNYRPQESEEEEEEDTDLRISRFTTGLRELVRRRMVVDPPPPPPGMVSPRPR